jgi:hypothetical protein
MAVLLNLPYSQFFDDSGNPLAGGLIYTYVAGTTTPKATYTDFSEVTPAANPVVLDSAGRAAIWITGSYRIDVKTSADVLVRSVDNITAYTAGGDMTKAVYDPANIAQQVMGLTAVQVATNKSISFSAGTASQAPQTLVSGTNLTTATAGSTEYDGKVQYFTPLDTQRGIIPALQQCVQDSTVVGTNGTGPQNIFTPTNGVTLSGSTYYEFEGVFYFSKTAGTTPHNFSMLFGGTATLNNISYKNTTSLSTSGFTSITAAPSEIFVQTASATAAISPSTAGAYIMVEVSGFVSVNAGGTFNPQYQLGAAPGGAYTTAIGSSFKIWPIGASGSNVIVGAWA